MPDDEVISLDAKHLASNGIGKTLRVEQDSVEIDAFDVGQDEPARRVRIWLDVVLLDAKHLAQQAMERRFASGKTLPSG